jgi:cell division protein FtsN
LKFELPKKGSDNRTNVGKGGISIVAFLDLNSNGKKDAGEPKAYGLNLRANGGRVEKTDRDTTIRILGLEPYTSCFIELDPNSFDNIAWRLPKQSLSVTVDPNILKYIEIPVSVRGEASGRVTLDENGEKRGLGRIIVIFSNSSSKTIGRSLTEEDGYFSYFGFIPGSYIASVDTSQLRKLGMIADPESLQFKISPKTEGDIVSGLDFILHKQTLEITDTALQKVPEKPTIRKDTTYMIVHEVTQELVTIAEDSYAIQLGAFRIKANADRLRRKLANLTDKKVEIIIEDGYYKVRISEIKERSEVDAIIETLRKNRVTELWVISQKAMHRQLVLLERQDTIRKITETIIPNPVLKNIPEMTIQLGAFRKKSNATALLEKLSLIYGKRVLIVLDKGFYKVRLTGIPVMKQEVLDVMKKLEPDLGKIGVKDLWVLPMNIKPVEEPEIRVPLPDITPVKPILEIPSFVRPVSDQLILKGMSQARAVPIYTLQVGTFYKYNEALRAQRRISSKLNVSAEIIKQWDYYRISIGGFFTKEETYRFYPELAGLGYTQVSLIEKKK